MAPRAPVRARVGPRIGRPLRAHARADPYRTYLRLGQSQWSRFDDRPAGLSGTLRPTTRADTWIFDGDLGPHDVLEPRLGVADTVIILDFSLLRCAWRSNPAIERGHRLLAVGDRLPAPKPARPDRDDRDARAPSAGSPATHPADARGAPRGHVGGLRCRSRASGLRKLSARRASGGYVSTSV